ncbi:MAG: PIG-L family deacetylase [Bdellovibrionota bacterium]|nr:PIG-L family deacetylase [Bdellovibrionota bacterium]
MKVLVVAAHSDDEMLGCGGTILKHVSQGDDVKIIFLTDGVGARKGDDSEKEKRESSTEKVMQKIGVEDYVCLDFPDNKLDSVALLEIVQGIEKKTKGYSPEVIYTHFYGDLNIDHQIVNRAVKTAFRPLPGCTVKKILSFEVVSSTEWGMNTFEPSYFVDVSEFQSKKMDALKLYDSEMRAEPHARSYENVLNLMKFRGNSIGLSFAEAFVVERIRE